MHKHHNWTKKQLEKQITSLMPHVDKGLFLYQQNVNLYIAPPFERSNKEYVTNTIKEFLGYRKTQDATIDFFYTLKPLLEKLRRHDEVMIFYDKKLLYHTYRILHFIFNYKYGLELHLSGELKPKTVAMLNGDQIEFLKKSNYKRNLAFKPDTFTKRYHILESFIYKKYYYHKEAMNHFLNAFTLIPPHQIKSLQDGSKEAQIINKMIDYFGTTHISSSKTILKSLAIILAYYMHENMKIKKKEVMTYLSELFNYYLNSASAEYQIPGSFAELTKNVYIKNRLALLPIFASSSKPHQSHLDGVNDLKWLYEDFEKEENFKFPKGFIEEFNHTKNPIRLYLLHSPMELLQQKL